MRAIGLREQMSPLGRTIMSSNLEDGIYKLGLESDPLKMAQLLQYASLLLKWNRAYSLTTITEQEKVIIYHLLDGLTLVNYLNGASSILDVGSGMGVPGVIIAIWCPDKQVCVIDCNHKKTAFLQQVAIELKLSNLTVVCSKIEDYRPIGIYDVAVSRAFASGRTFINLVRHLVKSTVMLMKSQKIHSEIVELAEYKYNILELNLPFSQDKRYLLKIEL